MFISEFCTFVFKSCRPAAEAFINAKVEHLWLGGNLFPKATEPWANFVKSTTGWLWATTKLGLGLVTEEIERVTGRLIKAVPELRDFKPVASWALGIVVTTGENLAPIVEWAKNQGPGVVARIRVFHPEDVDPLPFLEPWRETGFEAPTVRAYRNSRNFHQVFGQHLMGVTIADFDAGVFDAKSSMTEPQAEPARKKAAP